MLWKKKKTQNPNLNNNTEVKVINPIKVIEIFDKISDKNLNFLGFNPQIINPKWMIIQNLAVCPPLIRPSVSVSSLISQDDLTHQYIQILGQIINLKANWIEEQF